MPSKFIESVQSADQIVAKYEMSELENLMEECQARCLEFMAIKEAALSRLEGTTWMKDIQCKFPNSLDQVEMTVKASFGIKEELEDEEEDQKPSIVPFEEQENLATEPATTSKSGTYTTRNYTYLRPKTICCCEIPKLKPPGGFQFLIDAGRDAIPGEEVMIWKNKHLVKAKYVPGKFFKKSQRGNPVWKTERGNLCVQSRLCSGPCYLMAVCVRK